jgi:hypothetical protein
MRAAVGRSSRRGSRTRWTRNCYLAQTAARLRWIDFGSYMRCSKATSEIVLDVVSRQRRVLLPRPVSGPNGPLQPTALPELGNLPATFASFRRKIGATRALGRRC